MQPARLILILFASLSMISAAPFSGSLSYSANGSTFLPSGGLLAGPYEIFLASPVFSAAGSPVDVACNCLTPVATSALFTMAAQSPTYINNSSVEAGLHTVSFQLNFAPWTGGTVANSNSLQGADVFWNYSVTQGLTTFTGRVEVRVASTGACVWCENVSGTGTVNGGFFAPGASLRQVTYTFAGETTPSAAVPEPGSAGVVGFALVALVVFMARKLT
jgi:hypothetical protein